MQRGWLRFLLLLLAGDIERNPGPAKDSAASGVLLDLNVGFAPVTADRMSKCFGAFREWCTSKDFDWDRFGWHDPQALGWALRAYGMYIASKSGLPQVHVCVLGYGGTRISSWLSTRFFLLRGRSTRSGKYMSLGECRSVLPVIIVVKAALLSRVSLGLVEFHWSFSFGLCSDVASIRDVSTWFDEISSCLRTSCTTAAACFIKVQGSEDGSVCQTSTWTE